MSSELIPLDQFLTARLRESNGVFNSDAPRLGSMGEQRLGGSAAMSYVGRQLSAAEYDSYTEATLLLGRQVAVRQLIEIMRLNYNEYVETMSRFAQEYEKDYSLNWQRVTDMVIQVDRHILNFLTAMKTFFDHTQTRLDRTYGKESNQFKRYKTAERAAFDNNFSYRFVSKLRNYCQHCGMPLGYIKAGSSLESVPDGPVRHTLDFFFDRDSLLKDFNEWTRHVEPELRATPEQFPISPHLATTMTCLEEINSAVEEQSEAEIRQHLGVIDAFLGEIQQQEGTPCVFTTFSVDTRSAPGKTLVNLSFQRFHMQHLEEARRILGEIERRRTKGT
jgi:hypothetical protein